MGGELDRLLRNAQRKFGSNGALRLSLLLQKAGDSQGNINKWMFSALLVEAQPERGALVNEEVEALFASYDRAGRGKASVAAICADINATTGSVTSQSVNQRLAGGPGG